MACPEPAVYILILLHINFFEFVVEEEKHRFGFKLLASM